MPLVQTYADKYLAPLVTVDIETRAASDINDLGALPAEWAAKLTVLRAYIITCVESQRTPDDVFQAKLSAYRVEWKDQLAAARKAQAALDAAAAGASGSAGSMFSVDLYRG